MRVDELRIILDHLPDDLEVMVVSGYKLCHVGMIERRHGKPILELRAPTGFPVWAHPGVLWHQPAPQVHLQGRFRRPAELDAQLEAIGR